MWRASACVSGLEMAVWCLEVHAQRCAWKGARKAVARGSLSSSSDREKRRGHEGNAQLASLARLVMDEKSMGAEAVALIEL